MLKFYLFALCSISASFSPPLASPRNFSRFFISLLSGCSHDCDEKRAFDLVFVEISSCRHKSAGAPEQLNYLHRIEKVSILEALLLAQKLFPI